MAFAIMLSLISCGEPTSSEEGNQGSELLSTSANQQAPPIPYVSGDKLMLQDRTLQLARTVLPALSGSNLPAAVISPSGSEVLYSAYEYVEGYEFEKSWSELGIQLGDPIGRPTIRVADLEESTDELFAAGAESAAWNADGRIAYFQGDAMDQLAGETYLGRLVVRTSLQGSAVPWVDEPGDYRALAWSGDFLLFYSLALEDAQPVVPPGLYAAAGPGQYRRLENATGLIAVSPDGSKIVVSSYPEGGLRLNLIDVATGQTLDTLDMSSADASHGRPLHEIDLNGDWFGDTVVATTNDGLILFRVDGLSLDVLRRVTVPSAGFPMGLDEPRFADGGSRVIAWAPIPGQDGRAKGVVYVYLDCDVESGTCRRGPVPFKDLTLHPVGNPSRPLVGNNQ